MMKETPGFFEMECSTNGHNRDIEFHGHSLYNIGKVYSKEGYHEEYNGFSDYNDVASYGLS